MKPNALFHTPNRDALPDMFNVLTKIIVDYMPEVQDKEKNAEIARDRVDATLNLAWIYNYCASTNNDHEFAEFLRGRNKNG